MGKILGLDLGTNAIGWAIIDTDKKFIIDCGVLITTNQIEIIRENRTTELFKHLTAKSIQLKYFVLTKPFLFGLTFISIFTFVLTITDTRNWQFWLNISLTSLITILTMFHQDKKEK